MDERIRQVVKGKIVIWGEKEEKHKQILQELKDDVNALVVLIHHNYYNGNMSEHAYEQLNNNSEDLIDKTEVLLSTINKGVSNGNA